MSLKQNYLQSYIYNTFTHTRDHSMSFTQEVLQVEDFKNAFVTLALPLWVFSEPLPPVKTVSKEHDPIVMGPVKARPEGFTSWDKARSWGMKPEEGPEECPMAGLAGMGADFWGDCILKPYKFRRRCFFVSIFFHVFCLLLNGPRVQHVHCNAITLELRC